MIRVSALASAALVSLSLGGSLQAQQGPQAPNTSFFVTSVGGGDGAALGGLEGADAHCQRLAATIGAGGKTWRAYLSTSAQGGATPVNARDRIGAGPWQNSKGTVIATNLDDLHSANNKLGRENSLTERGTVVSGTGNVPNWHDVMTGSQADGRAWPAPLAMTCGNWTSNAAGVTMLGHIDKSGNPPSSWVAAHQSRSCSQPDLIATGGNGLFYCFAQ